MVHNNAYCSTGKGINSCTWLVWPPKYNSINNADDQNMGSKKFRTLHACDNVTLIRLHNQSEEMHVHQHWIWMGISVNRIDFWANYCGNHTRTNWMENQFLIDNYQCWWKIIPWNWFVLQSINNDSKPIQLFWYSCYFVKSWSIVSFLQLSSCCKIMCYRKVAFGIIQS